MNSQSRVVNGRVPVTRSACVNLRSKTSIRYSNRTAKYRGAAALLHPFSYTVSHIANRSHPPSIEATSSLDRKCANQPLAHVGYTAAPPKTCLGVRLGALLLNASASGQSSFLPSPRRQHGVKISRAECSTVPAWWACLPPLCNSWYCHCCLAGVQVPQPSGLFATCHQIMRCRPCPYPVKCTVQDIQQSTLLRLSNLSVA